MANHPLRTVVAVTLDTIHSDSGYIAPTRDPVNNTHAKVMAALKKSTSLNFDEEYWQRLFQLADEMIGFFRVLDTLPIYKEIQAQTDAAMYATCITTAKSDEVTTSNFAYAVAMPHMYSLLNPNKPKALNPNQSEAKIIPPGEYMGTMNTESRFFVKLVEVGEHDQTRGGVKFIVHDRSGNVGIFYEKLDKLKSLIYLGDCFAIHATPTRQVPLENGQKQTVFRTVTIIKDTIKPGKDIIDSSKDVTHQFVK